MAMTNYQIALNTDQEAILVALYEQLSPSCRNKGSSDYMTKDQFARKLFVELLMEKGRKV